MSTTAIITTISAALAVLVVVVFAMQQIEKSNNEKQALIAALKSRLRGFHHLLDGFPEGFLSADLRALVCHCLLDSTDQLIKLEPRNKDHRAERDRIMERLNKIRSEVVTAGYQPLTNPDQIQEVQRLLNSLYNVVQKLVERKRITQLEGASFARQIATLTVRVAVDSHLQSAQQALSDGKPRLAIHYYSLAVDKMKKSNTDGQYSSQMQLYEQRIAELEVLAEQQQTSAVATPAEEWEDFREDDDAWKKKSLYD